MVPEERPVHDVEQDEAGGEEPARDAVHQHRLLPPLLHQVTDFFLFLGMSVLHTPVHHHPHPVLVPAVPTCAASLLMPGMGTAERARGGLACCCWYWGGGGGGGAGSGARYTWLPCTRPLLPSYRGRGRAWCCSAWCCSSAPPPATRPLCLGWCWLPGPGRAS